MSWKSESGGADSKEHNTTKENPVAASKYQFPQQTLSKEGALFEPVFKVPIGGLGNSNPKENHQPVQVAF